MAPKPMHAAELPGASKQEARGERRRKLAGITIPPNPNSLPMVMILLGLEKQYGAVSQVEINEVLGF